jgi:AcrR family transcriptional regulator
MGMTVGTTSTQSQTASERIDPRIVRTHKMIENAFLELLWEVGFEATTVRDIAQRAGVNRATFYAHFEDKYDLFNYVLERGLANVIQTHLPADATFRQENLKLLLLALIDFFERGNELGCTSSRNQLMRPLIESRVQEEIALLLRRWLDATPGLLLRTTPAMTATLLSWALFGLGLAYTDKDNQRLDDHEINGAVAIMFNGAIQ